MHTSAARLISIAGHPAVLMPVAVAIASQGAGRTTALLVALLCVAAVLAYSFHKVRRGDWAHVDASMPAERAELNSRLGTGLFVAALALELAGFHGGFSLVLGLSGMIVITAFLLRERAKPSLHVAFAIFATVLAWPHLVAAAALAAMALAVCWSRMALRRHVLADVLLGVALGAAAGVLFHLRG